MTASIHQFAAADTGTSSQLAPMIGATPSAGDWLFVIATGGADGGGLDLPQVADDIDTMGADWIQVADGLTAVADSNQIRVTAWAKRCVGFESQFFIAWPSNANKSCTGFLASNLGVFSELYVIDQGEMAWDGTHMQFQIAGGTIHDDGEPYVGSAGFSRQSLSFADFTGGVSGEGGAGDFCTDGCGTVAHYNTDDGHTTGDALKYGLNPQEPAYAVIVGFKDPATTAHVFGAQAYGGSDVFGQSGRTLYQVSIGGVAEAGDWILLGTSSSAGHCGPGELPVVTDNIDTVGSDWVLVLDETTGTGGYGSGTCAARWWKKLCVGGETNVTADFLGSTNKAMSGIWLNQPTQPDVYTIDDGTLVWNSVDSMVYASSQAPHTDAETYVSIALGGGQGGSDPSFATMNPPGEADTNNYEDASGSCFARTSYNNSEEVNTTADTFTYTLQPEVPTHVVFFGFTSPPVNTVSPFIDNTAPAVGDVLTGDPGTWTGDVSGFTYQWLNYDGSDHNIGGATDITYTVQESDVGKAIWLDVRAHSPVVDEPGVEAVSSHTDNVVESGSGTEYDDAGTVTLVGVISAAEDYEQPPVTTVFDVGDHSASAYVRAGRENVITVATTDNPITFVLQTSPDGETWYGALDKDGNPITLTATAGSSQALHTQPGWFHLRLACTAAPGGPATCVIGFRGGY